MTIIMNHRQIVDELQELIPAGITTTTHWDEGQLERIQFLLEWLSSDFHHLPRPETCIVDHVEPEPRKAMSLHFYRDPGHGWLEVDLDFLRDLSVDLDISSYSYLHDGLAYLEEDCDLNTFMVAAKHHGWDIDILDNPQDTHCWVRDLPRYKVAL